MNKGYLITNSREDREAIKKPIKDVHFRVYSLRVWKFRTLNYTVSPFFKNTISRSRVFYRDCIPSIVISEPFTFRTNSTHAVPVTSKRPVTLHCGHIDDSVASKSVAVCVSGFSINRVPLQEPLYMHCRRHGRNSLHIYIDASSQLRGSDTQTLLCFVANTETCLYSNL